MVVQPMQIVLAVAVSVCIPLYALGWTVVLS
jgi:hypothetical protein